MIVARQRRVDTYVAPQMESGQMVRPVIAGN
jgi:hypothetical protein